ncbi:short-chain dehydrogenase [Marinicauda salina]|uniref:Short-chain dehydrogenase n=1 Tax=Marinicauda salina TaxID=2135793 RepID=A0A2U2BVS3_9PROT|nr:SDR family NAD(P)-dependent oxidoreductase [Marinicauda salina]PWE18121.1 short-chain dehydrogenase [Marinicauda salina]
MKAALVTGGSSGIGLALSRRLALQGRPLLWASLSEDEIEGAKSAIRHSIPDARIHGLAIDLAEPGAAQAVFDWATARADIDLLVNNAGFGAYGESRSLDLDREQGMIAVNAGALHALTRLFLRRMEDTGGGTIVNLASNSAFTPTPNLAVYAATKAFVKHYSEALAQELKAAGSPVRVMTVCPSAVADTPFLHAADMDGVRTFTSFTATTAEEVAGDVMAGLEQGAEFVLTGAAMRRAYWLMKILPAPLVRMMVRREVTRV